MRRAFVLFALFALPASAQTPPETQVLPRLIDTLCIDLIEERNGCETAVLLVSDSERDAADLIIFSDRRAEAAQEVLAVVRGIAFNGTWFGQAPSLEQAENGSLLLRAEQIGIGRTPWSLTLTIVHRTEGFLIAGLTYRTYDRLFAGTFSCDVNILTGDWITFAETPHSDVTVLEPFYQAEDRGQIEGARLLLADWTLDTPLPGPCEDGLAQWAQAEPQ